MKEKLTKESTGYAQIKNEVLVDTKISLKAKGLFAYLYSKPDDWDFSGDRMAKENMEGRRAIYAALKELETEGYLSRTKKPDGKVVYHISFTKKPNVQNGQQAKKPNARNSKEPKQQRAKTGSISNKEIITNKEVDSNKEIINENSPIEKQIGEVIYLFRNLNPMYKTWFNRNPVRKKCQELLETFGFVKVKNAIGFAESIIAVEFAPEITTPAELGTKWGKLQAYYMKKKVSNQNKGKNYDD
jgi:hypothetical protein